MTDIPEAGGMVTWNCGKRRRCCNARDDFLGPAEDRWRLGIELRALLPLPCRKIKTGSVRLS